MKNLNKKFQKTISLFIGLVLILSSLPLTVNAQAFFDVSYPILKTSNYTDNPNTANWQQTISAKPGDVVSFLIYYYNNSSETAKNVKVRLDLPSSKNTTQTVKSYIFADNANWVSGSATINLSSAENFTLMPETIAWYPNQSTQPSALLSGQNGSEIVQTAGLSLGDIPAGTASRGYVKVRAKVSQTTTNGTPKFDITYPILQASNYTKNPATYSWSDTVSADAGETVSLKIYYYNSGDGVAKNVKVRLDLPTTQSQTQKPKAYLQADNANWVSGSVEINLSSNQTLALIPGNVYWYPNQSSQAAALLSSQTGQEVVEAQGLLLGDIPAGVTSRGYVVVRAKVSQNTIQTYAKFDTAYPVLQASNYTKNPGSSSSWSNTVSADAGEIVSFKIYYFNNGNIAAQNTKIRLDLPSQKATSHKINANVWADNANYVMNTVNLSLTSAQTLTLLPETIKWYANNQSTQTSTLPNSQTGSAITQTNGLLIGNIGPGSPLSSASATYTIALADDSSRGYIMVRAQISQDQSVTAPTVSTTGATNIFSNSATLNGTLDGLGTSSSADVWFEWGTTTNYGSSTSRIVRSTTGAFSSTLTGLSASTTYYYRAVAESSAGRSYGNSSAFTTPSSGQVNLPSVSTSSATSITNNSAFLNGSLDNLGNASTVDVWFEYGTTTSFGNSTSRITRNYTGSFNTNISNLVANTIYYFRTVASNSAGTVYGSTYNFITTTSQNINSPTVSTNYASSINNNSATLNGSLNNLGGASLVDIWFDWGTTVNLGNSINHMTGGATGTFLSTLTGLSANTTYYYRAMSSNSAGTSYGSVLTFTTQSSQTSNQPEIATLQATEITTNSVILNGQVNAHNFSTRVYFAWGENYSNLNNQTAYSSYSDNEFKTFNYRLINLKPSTLYYYRAVAVTGSTTINGEIKNFTTKTQTSAPATKPAPKPTTSKTTTTAAPKTSRPISAPVLAPTPTTTPVCTVGEWQKSTCGGSGCLNYERLEKRVANPAGCDIEARCIPDPECSKIAKVVFLATSIASETAEPGEIIDYKITYKNTLPENITNTMINLTIPESAVFQKFTVTSIISKGNIESFMTSKSDESVSVDTLTLKLGNLAGNEEGEIIVKIRIDDDVAEGSILNFPVQLSYNDPQITVFSSDNIKIKKIRGAFANVAGALGGLAGFGIPVWLIIIIVLAIALSLTYLRKNKGKKPPVLPQNNNKSKILRSSDEGMNGKTELKINGNLNHNGSKTTVEIPKPDLSSKSNQK